MTDGHTKERLKELQALPLERKVGFTAARIVEWHNHYQGKVYVSFSGGKDSTVLLYLVRSLFPNVKAVFVDTGLEYPEIKDFVKTFDDVEILRPKMGFKEVIDTYGWPVIGKQVAENVQYAKPGNTRMARLKGEYQSAFFDCHKWEFLLNAPFKISARCCDKMKKDPAKEYQRKTKTYPFIGTMTQESSLRLNSWIQQGCNSFGGKYPTSKPMSFWTEQDVLAFIKLKNLPLASVYGEIAGDRIGDYRTTGCRRTGCVFCMFGIKQDGCPNRIQRLAKTHPKLWDYCVNKLGMREVMDFIGEPCDPEPDLFDGI